MDQGQIESSFKRARDGLLMCGFQEASFTKLDQKDYMPLHTWIFTPKYTGIPFDMVVSEMRDAGFYVNGTAGHLRNVQATWFYLVEGVHAIAHHSKAGEAISVTFQFLAD